MSEKFAIESSENIIKARRLVVRTTSGDVESFDSKKIIHSLMSETNINENVANKVTDMVLKRIINANIQWLSGPAIREMCCSVLAEIGLLEARKRYTRIGMPLMDYENFIEIGIKENANQYQNPMSIHSWCADRISSEYALLRLLTEDQSKAHLRGDIHIHMLRYFDLRPFCQEFDLRIILKNGLPPVNWPYSAVSKPAKHPIVAFLHAAKWLGLVTGEFAGGLGYDNFNVWLAPYIRGLSEKEVEQLAQCFIFESNQIYASRGGQIPFTSISCVPTIPNNLREVPAIGFEGKISGVYGDYIDECNALFKAISKVYYNGDGIGRLFNFPKHEIKLKKEWMREFEDDYLLISEESSKFGNPYYLNMAADWMPDEVHSQCLPYDEPLISRVDGRISFSSIGQIVSEEIKYQKVDSKELDKSFWLKPKREIEVLSIDPITRKIDFQAVTNLFYKSEKSKIITLQVDGGLEISTNENHPIIVLDSEKLNLRIKKAKEVVIGDFILKMTSWKLSKFDSSNHYEIDLIDFLIQNKNSENITVYGFDRKILMTKNQSELAKQLKVPKDRIGWWRRSNSITLKSYLQLNPDPKERNNIYLVPKGGKGRIKAKIICDENLLTFLGFYLAEGSIQKQRGIRLSFGSFETEIIEEVEKLIKEIFGLRAKRRYQIDPIKNYNHCNIEVNSHLFIDLIKYWNMGNNARSKRLPDFVFQLPNKLTGHLIRSLFLGDGYIRNSKNFIEISLHISSEELVQGVHYLLLRHGINSTISRRKKSVKLSIERGESMKLFIQLIPEWKEKFDKYIDEKKRYLPPISERFPSKLINKQKINERVKKGIITQSQKHNRTIGKKFLQLIPNIARTPLLDILEKSDSFNLVRVKKIKQVRSSDKLYDLEVGLLEKKGNFVHGDGLITHNCCRLILTPEGIRKICDNPDLFDWSKSYINLGSLQSVSLNLPRYTYKSNSDEDKFFEILEMYLQLAKGILLFKRDLIEKRLESGLLPLCSRKLDNNSRLLDLRKQSVNIGFVGLNECVKSLTNYELHENNNAYNFGKRILQYMAKKCDEFTEENSFKFSLWEQPAESSAGRFALLDLKHYPDKVIIQGNPKGESAYYTNSDHLRYSANIPLFERIQKQAEFHPIVQGGVITHVWLGESYPDPEGLWKLTKKIALNTPTAYWAYTKDFTQCLTCNKFHTGIYTTCPHCGATSENLEWWSRITGYYSRLTGWNASKVEEWKERKRYNFNQIKISTD